MNYEEKEKIKEKKIKKRENFEKKNQGDYELIYPITINKEEELAEEEPANRLPIGGEFPFDPYDKSDEEKAHAIFFGLGMDRL